MALSSNLLQKQVDLPVWEWLRPLPVVATTGLSASCVADTALFHPTSGRYLYILLNATNFWRYDTISDTYLQLASPPQAPVSPSSIRFAGSQGFYNRVIAATSTTIDAGLPSARAAVGYKIRILSGKGAGQERVITAVSDPIVVDSSAVTTGATTSITDTSRAFITSYTGSTANVNGYANYMVRIITGTGINQTRKILYHSATQLVTGDVNFVQNDPFASNTIVAPGTNSAYQIEYNTLTVDTAWTVTPDSTSRFVIQSGGIWLVSGAAATPFYTLQYYDVLHDMWYSKPAHTQMFAAAGTEMSLERMTENSSLWYQSVATGGSTTTIVDTAADWTTNEWANYCVYIYSGTGLEQISKITSNTGNTLTFASIGTAAAAGSKYQILGYDCGISSGSNTYNTLNDSTESWAANRWDNYAVRILAGKGAGQLRTIVSNSSTTLTLAKAWSVLPDETSIYSIQGDSEQMYIAPGGVGEIFVHNGGYADVPTHSRITETGIACVAAAWLSNADHVIYEQMPFALSSLSGTTTITATTVQPHNLKVGQYVSIRGVTNSTDQYNVCGLVQIASVPSITTFTYTPPATGSGTYTLGLTALSTSVLTDASKDYRDNVSSSNTTTITFGRKTPTNINGWYASGTNIAIGTRVVSGAGTVTVTLSSTQAGSPTGVIVFSPWGPTTNYTATGSGGGAGVATVSLSANAPANCNGWLITGTGIPVNTKVFSGQGTSSLVLTNACSGAVSGTVTLVPHETAGKLIYYNSAAPAITTGAAAAQCAFVSGTSGGSSVSFVGAAAAAPTAAVSRYAIGSLELLGSAIDGQNLTYFAGVMVGTQSTTQIQDTNAYWSTATGSAASAGLTTITLSATAPGSVNGWFIAGTGITAGTWIVSGAGTTTLTLSRPTSGAVSGTMTCTAWNNSLISRRVKMTTSTGISQDLALTAVTPTTGVLTFGTATAGATGTTAYCVYSLPARGAGSELNWVSNNSGTNSKGRFIWVPRCGGVAGIDKLDLSSDKVVLNYYIPFTETLTTGTYWAYDQGNRIYFQKDATLRMYYIDLDTNTIHGAGMAPYAVGTAQIGNKMDIITTADGLKYLYFNRHGGQEMYRQLLFY